MKINIEELNFLSLIDKTIETGIEEKDDRTKVGIRFLPPCQLKFSLENNTIPLLQTREIFWKNVFWEMIWIIRGETNIKYLNDRNVNIWNSWADKNGDLGPIYGKMLRESVYVPDIGVFILHKDQLEYIVNELKTNPTSRRIAFSLWNVAAIQDQALPACHANFFQFIVDNNKKELYSSLTCRSTDLVLGAPVNIAEWSLFSHLIGRMTGFKAKEITINFNFPHVYLNQIEKAKKWLERKPEKEFPRINILKDLNTIKDLEELSIEDVKLFGYEPVKPNFKFQVAV